MKKTIIAFFAFCLMTLASSCNQELLDTVPTTAVSGDFMLENTEGGFMALNGTLRFVWRWGQTTTGNYHQCFGIQSYALMGDLMGEDMVMAAQGSGWFWYDYNYNVKSRFSSTTWRPYDAWNYYYTIISQVNYILAAQETMVGAKAEVDYIMGNAYALRAYAYHYLAMTFARSYIGHEDRLSVPIYTEPTSAGTEGKPRSTNREVYAQAMSDINQAVTLLNGKSQMHVSHIDQYVANGIKARIALYMGDYKTAYEAAAVAVKGGTIDFDKNFHYNDATHSSVLWGAEVITSQGTTNPQFLVHMDIDYNAGSGYGGRARKCCSTELYDQIADSDLRKTAWWSWQVLADGKTYGYQQWKFQFANKAYQGCGKVDDTTTGADHIFMRAAEMQLIMAECQARLSNEGQAKELLNELMKTRQPDYDCSGKSGLQLGKLTTDKTGSLLEEIILQRRIELWGEYGRIYDIKRLRQGFERTLAMGHPQADLNVLATNNCHLSDPESFDWVLTIPQKELDANPYMVQNPLGSYASDGYGDDPALNK